MFCCDGLKISVGEAGERRISILVSETNGEFRFHLQFRAVSKQDEVFLSQNPTPLAIKGNVSLAAMARICFCPFCWKNLRTLVAPSTFRRFRALAEEHKIFFASYA
jgi:hypothetical protein